MRGFLFLLMAVVAWLVCAPAQAGEFRTERGGRAFEGRPLAKTATAPFRLAGRVLKRFCRCHQ